MKNVMYGCFAIAALAVAALMIATVARTRPGEAARWTVVCTSPSVPGMSRIILLDTATGNSWLYWEGGNGASGLGQVGRTGLRAVPEPRGGGGK